MFSLLINFHQDFGAALIRGAVLIKLVGLGEELIRGFTVFIASFCIIVLLDNTVRQYNQ